MYVRTYVYSSYLTVIPPTHVKIRLVFSNSKVATYICTMELLYIWWLISEKVSRILWMFTEP